MPIKRVEVFAPAPRRASCRPSREKRSKMNWGSDKRADRISLRHSCRSCSDIGLQAQTEQMHPAVVKTQMRTRHERVVEGSYVFSVSKTAPDPIRPLPTIRI